MPMGTKKVTIIGTAISLPAAKYSQVGTPSSPEAGDLWNKTDTNELYIYEI